MATKGDLDALILGALQNAPAHGYEIGKRISDKTDRLLKIGEGQMYPALHRLESKGLLTSGWIPQEGKPARKVYHITSEGLKELSTRRDAWAKLSAGITSVLQGITKVEANRG